MRLFLKTLLLGPVPLRLVRLCPPQGDDLRPTKSRKCAADLTSTTLAIWEACGMFSEAQNGEVARVRFHVKMTATGWPIPRAWTSHFTYSDGTGGPVVDPWSSSPDGSWRVPAETSKRRRSA